MKKFRGSVFIWLVLLWCMGVQAEEILDPVNSLPVNAFDWERFFYYVGGGLLFLAGFLTAKYMEKKDAS